MCSYSNAGFCQCYITLSLKFIIIISKIAIHKMKETFYRLGSHSPKTVGGPTMKEACKKNAKANGKTM